MSDFGKEIDKLEFDDSLLDDCYQNNSKKSTEPLAKELIMCYIYELRELDKVIFGYLESMDSEMKEFGELCIKVKATIEYCVYDNPDASTLKSYIEGHFSYSYYLLVYDFIEQTIDIANNKIYSAGYFDKYFSSHYISGTIESFFRDILKSAFYNFHNGNHYIFPTWDAITKKKNLNFSDFREVNTVYNPDCLYHDVENVCDCIFNEMKSLAKHISDEIRGLEIVDIYQILSHKYVNSYYTNNVSSDEIKKLTDISDIKNKFTKFIEECAKYELNNRVETACRNYLSHDIYMDLLSMPPGFSVWTQDIETTREILWAWNYILLHKPDDLELDDKMQERYVFVHLVDVLPALEPHYRKKYSSFSKRYNKPNRKHFFTDMTEIYKKSMPIPSQDFFVGKANSI